MVKIIKTDEYAGFFTRSLEKFLTQENPDYLHKTISPSQITECMRYQVSQLVGFPTVNQIEARYQRIFDNGNFVHKRYLQKYIPRMGCACRIWDVKDKKWKDFIEVSLQDPEYWLKGSPDALIFNPEDGQKYVFELKSIKHSNFQNLFDADPSYIAQVHLYMYLTNVPRSVILYECKDDQELKEFLIPLDQKILDDLLARIRTIQKFVLEYPSLQVLPECENPHSKYPCKCNSIDFAHKLKF